MNSRIRNAAIELMSRDHVGDVNRLDTILGKKESATLSNLVPPNPYVGNPSNLIPDECIALIGINPRLDLDRKGFQEYEINIPLRCQAYYARTGKRQAFDSWFKKLHNFYQSDAYYGRYFTKLGNHIGRAWYTAPAEGEPGYESLIGFQGEMIVGPGPILTWWLLTAPLVIVNLRSHRDSLEEE